MKTKILYSLTGVIASFLFLSCDPFNAKLESDDVEYFQAKEIRLPEVEDTLKAMTWNIKFGGGRIDFFFDCWGDRVVMTEEEVNQNLDSLMEFLKAEDPDILFMQEVDLDSKRTAYVNQVQYILDRTAFNYAVFASQWKVDYVPSDGIGKVNSGNVIMSKWPLTDAERIGLPLFEEQNPIVRYFYLRRNILQATSIINEVEVQLMCTHLSAYDYEGLRIKQIDILVDTLNAIDARGIDFIVGADMNLVPRGTKHLKEFEDVVCTDSEFASEDFTGQEPWLDPILDRYSAEFDANDYSMDNSPYFTHTINMEERGGFWNRKLDYLFSNGHFVPGSNITHQDEKTGRKTMHLSDHCPVSVLYVISKED
jgi:endonuclease/exonuclease/phosphatase family metal-dependent hydrolase